MGFTEYYVNIFVSLVLFAFLGLILNLFHELVVKPMKLQAILLKQGIKGPPLSLLIGNIREIKKAQSSQVFVFSLGTTQTLLVNQPDAVKEITTCMSLALGKPSYQQKDRGPLKILSPELYMDNVRMNLIVESTFTLVDSWKTRIEVDSGIADIKIDEYMRSFSGDVISRACFGSNYCKGEEIFLKLRALREAMSKKGLSTGVPRMRYLPIKSNREAWELEKEVRDLILHVVKERKGAATYEKDFLQMVSRSHRFVVDNCKNIYLAGYETTAVSATWCLMLLTANQEWQDNVRTEVVEICRARTPDAGMLRKMKLLTKVIQESLRLYLPVAVVSREALEDIKFGEIFVPKGVNIWMMVLALHTDPEIWGEDAYRFNPDRFSNGIKGACKLPQVYMPFGVGPRVCLGQNLAMVELKLLMSLLLSNFSFSLSPNYTHSPVLRLVIERENGVHILVKKL
ncbi:hypothetical protein V6Z11_A07G209500 [Gossypium hirsutum]